MNNGIGNVYIIEIVLLGMEMNVIRGVIVFVMGVFLVVFPKLVYKFQDCLIGKLGINYDVEKERWSYLYIGIVLIVLGIVLVLI